MKILIAPDKFKGSLSALEVCMAIEKGIKEFDSKFATILHPLADGGEGTLAVLDSVLDLQTIKMVVKDPLFRPIEAVYKLQQQTAFIEMATASGLELLAAEERNCLYTTTFGTGELILDAIQRGAKNIYLFVGGSATNDAGMGMAAALGYRFLDDKNKEILPIGENLPHLKAIDHASLKVDISAIECKVVCDVKNPLYGKNGAAWIYGPQKGADENAVKLLNRGLKRFSKIVEKDLSKKVADIPGAGAAGGLGAGAMAFLNASILPGIQTLIDITGLKNHLQGLDLIITGEGKMDEQTAQGKVIAGLAELAKQNNIPLAVICGSLEASAETLQKLGISKIRAIKTEGISLQQAIEEASIRIENIAFAMMKEFFGH